MEVRQQWRRDEVEAGGGGAVGAVVSGTGVTVVAKVATVDRVAVMAVSEYYTVSLMYLQCWEKLGKARGNGRAQGDGRAQCDDRTLSGRQHGATHNLAPVAPPPPPRQP